jgi:hypothetical protein
VIKLNTSKIEQNVQNYKTPSKDEEGWTVQQFMSAHCKGDIRAEMPGEFLNIPIVDVMKLTKGGSARANRCLKLLKEQEYRK